MHGRAPSCVSVCSQAVYGHRERARNIFFAPTLPATTCVRCANARCARPVRPLHTTQPFSRRVAIFMPPPALAELTPAASDRLGEASALDSSWPFERSRSRDEGSGPTAALRGLPATICSTRRVGSCRGMSNRTERANADRRPGRRRACLPKCQRLRANTEWHWGKSRGLSCSVW